MMTSSQVEIAKPEISSPALSTIKPSKSLISVLPVEIGSAVASAALITPFISIIDKAIFENASGRMKLAPAVVSGLRLLVTKPLTFARQPSCYLIWGLYVATYTVANTIQATCESANIDWFYPKFVGTSFANVTLSVLKDLYFTRAFGKGSIKPVPLRSYGMYTIRDTMTVFAGFNLPTLMAETLSTNFPIERRHADVISQLVAPCAVQALSCPLHLYGMDYYNRPGNLGFDQRWAFIKREYFGTTLARMGRILPAYGIGGVANKFFRAKGYEMLG
ncbi:uncharacterized protein BJ171DRAFT_439618 [Polychytrium aggregatum]|uniref:uncharacterized protein n=1 Tax=Polychytrium aggregatum TaxID=110093 RepID=UPI0022FE807F|nr:uncharacterized protein BJ171DRAFT_439618 [Polychytrium aggregatum]KAI9207345.1 hypothetical protein BJ171DRAFT_439618 [Polychytrium aggregatum]